MDIFFMVRSGCGGVKDIKRGLKKDSMGEGKICWMKEGAGVSHGS